MIVDPVNLDETRASEWVRAWLNEEQELDPFAALVQHFRSEAAYHESIEDRRMACVCERHARLVELVVHAIRTAEVDYATAGVLTNLEPTTVRNKKSDRHFDAVGQASRGKVRLGALPLVPLRFPGLHAARAVEQIEQIRAREAEKGHLAATRQDEDATWAEEALMVLAE